MPVNPLQGFLLQPPEGDRLDKESAKAASTKLRHKRKRLFRASRTEKLREIFPRDLVEGDSVHVISAGDIDATSYLILLAERYGPFDHLYASTWTLSRQDVELLDDLLETGQIAAMDFFAGEYFAARETAVYASLLEIAKKHGCRVRLFRNHAKLIAVRNEATGFYAVVETSANFTTNPRTEQAAVHVSRELYDFYREFFEDLLAKKTLNGEKAALRNAQKALAGSPNRGGDPTGRD